MDLTNIQHWMVNTDADYRTRDWPLLGSYIPALMIQLTYLFIIKIGGPSYMKNRKPYDLKRVIQIYNLIQIISCVLILKTINNNITWKVLLSCDHPERTYDYHAMQQAKVSWWFFILKIFELNETIFFVLRKKNNQVSFLHVHHHVVLMTCGWLLATHYPGGAALFPVYLNTFIHLIMYTYYLLSTFGPQWQNTLAKWKNKITLLQMLQFTIIILHICQMFFVDGCFDNIPMIVLIVLLPNLIIVFKNFYDFYQNTYNKKSPVKIN